MMADGRRSGDNEERFSSPDELIICGQIVSRSIDLQFSPVSSI